MSNPYPGTKYYAGEEEFYDEKYHTNFVDVHLPGFPEQQEEVIEFPDPAEMMLAPMFNFCMIEDFYKYATDFQKKVIDKCPLQNKHKHVIVSYRFRLVYPGVTANSVVFGDRNEWHVDGLRGDTYTHVIMSGGDCRTEFNTRPVTIAVPNHKQAGDHWFELMSLKYGNEWGLNPKKIDGNRWGTFTNHVHRASLPTKPEFRSFFRVIEVDNEKLSSKYNPNRGKMITSSSVIWNGVGESQIPNIDQRYQGVFINIQSGEYQKQIDLIRKFDEAHKVNLENYEKRMGGK
jgi:hypothetical protein